jgi:predicted nucleotidyltransferase
MTHDEAEKIGIGKSTLHYLRRKAKSDNSFKVYGKVGRKLNDALLHTMSNESFAGNYV